MHYLCFINVYIFSDLPGRSHILLPLHRYYYQRTATTVPHVVFSLVPIIVVLVTCGCLMKSVLTIVKIVDSVASVVLRTSSTVTIAACASTELSTTITIAKTANTSPIVPSAKNTSFRLDPPVTKCPADMPFTGTVSVNSRRMIHVVPCARRLRKPRSA